MALKIVKEPESLTDWAKRQSTMAIECRLGRHWIASITDTRHTRHGWSERYGCFDVIQPCRRGCGTEVRTFVDSATGELRVKGRYRYDPRYKRTGAGRMTAEEKGQLRLILIGRAAEKDKAMDTPDREAVETFAPERLTAGA